MNVSWLLTRGCDLAADRAISFAPRQGAVLIRLYRGCLVITQEGDYNDYTLAPGESLRVAGRGPVVIWAPSASTFIVARSQHGCKEIA